MNERLTLAEQLLQQSPYRRAERELGRILGDDPGGFAALSAALLQQNRHEEALAAAVRGLALDPAHAGCAAMRARAGTAQALAARSPVYRILLRTLRWMSRLGSGARWLVILGGLAGYRLLGGAARPASDLRPIVLPILIAYGACAAAVWIARPLFDLLLRLHPAGRLALTAERRRAANWIGGLIAVAAGALLGHLLTGSAIAALAAAVAGLLLLPVAGYYEVAGRRRALRAGIIGLAAAGAGSILLKAAGLPGEAPLFVLFMLGIAASTWIIQMLAARR